MMRGRLFLLVAKILIAAWNVAWIVWQVSRHQMGFAVLQAVILGSSLGVIMAVEDRWRRYWRRRVD